MLAYKTTACEACILWWKPTEALKNPSPISESMTGKPAMVALKNTTRLFHGPWHDPVGEHLRAQPCRMWNRLRFHPFLQVSQIFQRRKSDANKQDFENKLNLTCLAHSTTKTIGILTKVFWTSGPNSVVLAWTDDELSGGQAENGVNFDFEGKFDLEGKGQSPPKTIRTLTKVIYIYGLNLVILAWTGLELSRGQASDWHTDGQTDAGNDNSRWPYRPRVMNDVARAQLALCVCVYDENKQRLVSDEDTLIFIALSSEECVCCIWNSFRCSVWFHEQSAT